MAYESAYERFEAAGPGGLRRGVEFKKSGFLTRGDQPELYFFSVAGQETVVRISASALGEFQLRRRYLSREEKSASPGCAEAADRSRRAVWRLRI